MGLEALIAQQIVGLSEAIDDRTASLLVAGTGITLTYNDGAGTLTIATDALRGSTGSTDNRILRSDGTGGATVQNSAVTIDDNGNISGLGTVGCGAITSSGLVTGTKAVASDGYVYGAPQFYSSAFGATAGFQIGTLQQCSIYGGGTALASFENTVNGIRFDGSRPIGFVNGHALANASDVTLRRNSTGPTLETRSAGGVIINDATGSSRASLGCGALTASSNVTCQSGFELASRTKAAVLASSTAVNSGRFQLSDAGLIGREVYADGTNWRYSSDDSIVT